MRWPPTRRQRPQGSTFGRLSAGIGAVFGLGAIAWFVAVGLALLRVRQEALGKQVAA